jgi:hypothetical protein
MRISGTDTSRYLYKIVKAFLKDFYTESKEGTIKHWKGLIVFLFLVFLCLVIFLAAAYKISEQPFFCGVCHNMKVYVASWKASSHRNVGCIECHYKPGFKNHVIGKWKDGQISLVYFVTGKVITKPHAEIDDTSCLNSGCHRRDDLKQDIIFKNVVFNHLKHIDKMKRDKQLRCTTCHSQIVQGTHMTVTEENCFICHFYKTKGQKEYETGCTSCHFEAKGNIKKGNYTFNHKKYIKRGVSCESCHTNVVDGDGHIPENVCLQCHNKRAILEAKYTPEKLHKNHVTDHKVECFLCHAPIKHKITGFEHITKEEKNCAQCHQNDIHARELLMYAGKGAKFVRDMPSSKASFDMDCTVCHRSKQGKNGIQATCKTCHGDLADGMLAQWNAHTSSKLSTITKDIGELKDMSFTTGDAKKFAGVLFNHEYVSRGKPAHNILYSLSILGETKRAIEDLRTKPAPTKSVPSKLTCTDTCHGNINEKKVSFGKVNFPHALHSEDETSCLKCHTPYTTHGDTFLKGCASCHHGQEMGKVSCKDCHRAEGAMLGAKGSTHIKLGCTDCHGVMSDGKKTLHTTVRNSCVRCHGKGYSAKVDDWTRRTATTTKEYQELKAGLEKEIVSLETKNGKQSVPLRKIFNEISEDNEMVITGRYAHNPAYSETVMTKTKGNIETLTKMMKDKREGKLIRLK